MLAASEAVQQPVCYYHADQPNNCTWRQATRRQPTNVNWGLIDSVVVLRPTQHKIGHFGDVPQANLLAWYGKN